MMPNGVRVLDVGCGTGSVTLVANRGKGNIVMAVEPDAQRAEVARSRGLNVHQGILSPEFIEKFGPFDVCMASDVLEHTAAPSDFIVNLVKATKPGGLILISVPNVAHWSVRLMLLRGRFEYEPCGIMDATHLRWFTASSIRQLFEAHHLTILELRQTAGTDLPVYHRALFRMIPGVIKSRAVRMLSRVFPRLFGVQHVVKATIGTN
jgi:2-polyprenyl-3-methyl-5-hydroxy-6-metoxy-1,4-benzoquinol methylase